MGLDISVYNPETGESLEMNWLRNPYGLCNWAEANYNYRTESRPDDESEQRLWYVINHWNYDKAEYIDRLLFLEVVKRYGRVLMELSQGYFFFTESALKQFVLPHLYINQLLPIYESPAVRIDHPVKEYGIPMEHFGHPCFELSSIYRPNAHMLQHYQAWYLRLVEFAEMLLIPGTLFYCSN